MTHFFAFTQARDRLSSTITAYFMVLVVIAISAFQPYKQKYQNTLDAILISNYALVIFMDITFRCSLFMEGSDNYKLYQILMECSITVGILYGTLVMAALVIPTRLLHKLWHFVLRKFKKKDENPLGESLPYREQDSEHSLLINAS